MSKDPFKNEQYLSRQRAALDEARRLLERLEGSLKVGVRVTGEFGEAQEVVGYIKETLEQVRIPTRDPFGGGWTLTE